MSQFILCLARIDYLIPLFRRHRDFCIARYDDARTLLVTLSSMVDVAGCEYRHHIWIVWL
jgi:hypothetical protein